MKKIKTIEAVGQQLCHDITKITKDFKGVLFKKGHVIRQEDVNILLDIGKEHIYFFENVEGFVHEDDAAIRLKNIIMGSNIVASEINEGKIQFIAKEDGLFKIDIDKLFQLNMIDDLILSVIKNNSSVKKGDLIGATKVIPLMVDEKKLYEAENLISEPIINIKKFIGRKISIITTGSEIFYGRIKDRFEEAIKNKIFGYNCEILSRVVVDDNISKIENEIQKSVTLGTELILCTGGMSVDPDDLTPSAIKNVGSEIITYGTPILPGAMFLMAYLKDIPIMGLPGSIMASKKTVFDIILPRVLAGEKISKEVIASLAEGGFLIN